MKICAGDFSQHIQRFHLALEANFTRIKTMNDLWNEDQILWCNACIHDDYRKGKLKLRVIVGLGLFGALFMLLVVEFEDEKLFRVLKKDEVR
jgi:hypothetical protein